MEHATMINVQFDAGDAARQLGNAARQIETEQAMCLEQLGIQILSFAKLDYMEKARGGTGSDGIKWKPDERSTIEARVRSRAPAKRIVERRRELAARIKEVIRQRSGRGKGRKGWVKSQLASLRKQRKAASARLQDLVDKEFASYEIGVDHGLQRASAQPGFQGGDGDGGNVFVIDQAGVTVGYGRSYSAAFDELRPLLPEIIPQSWWPALDAIAVKFGATILQNSIGQ